MIALLRLLLLLLIIIIMMIVVVVVVLVLVLVLVMVVMKIVCEDRVHPLGERALLENAPRAATVKVLINNCVCVYTYGYMLII